MLNILVIMLVGMIYAVPQVNLDRYPSFYQLFARDSTDSASIEFSGVVVNDDSLPNILILDLMRNGECVWSDSFLVSDTGAIPFAFYPRIRAELATYSVKLICDTTEIFLADSLVCGDIFLVNGQSNALANSGSEPTETSPWFRSFGSMLYEAESWGGDTVWCRAQNREPLTLGSVGEWALRMGLLLVERHSIPICVINGAVSGTVIDEHFPTSLNREDLTTIYGRLLYRCNKAGVADKVKGMLWYQGEHHTDSVYGRWGEFWDSLRVMWQQDYPSIKLIVVTQIRHGCGNAHQDVVRNAQRKLADRHHDVKLITVGDINGHDGCHFIMDGYFAIGERVADLLSGSLYGFPKNPSLAAPRLLSVKFASKHKKSLFLEFDQPVFLQPDNGAKRLRDYFYFTDTATRVETLIVNEKEIRLVLNKTAIEVDSLTYTPNIYYPGTFDLFKGPYIIGERGQPALTFYKEAVQPPPDTVPIDSMMGFTDSVVEQYAIVDSVIKIRTVNYIGEVDTVYSGYFLASLDSFLLVADSFNVLYGKNRGTARVAVCYRGLFDTVSIQVVKTGAILDSLKIYPQSYSLFEKDSTVVQTVAHYNNKGRKFLAVVDSLVTWSVSELGYISFGKGYIVGERWSDSMLIVTASLDSINSSTRISVFERPQFLQRIRFRGSSIPHRINWVNDTGGDYSFSSGVGWLGGNRYFMDAPKGPLHIRIAMQPDENTNTIIMAGSDTLRLRECNGRMVFSDSIFVTGFEGILFKFFDKPDYLVAQSLPSAIDIGRVADDGFVPCIADSFFLEDNAVEGRNSSGSTALVCSPNPANPAVLIKWSILSNNGGSALTISDVTGRVLREWSTSDNGTRMGEIYWNGVDSGNRPLSSGIFVIRLFADCAKRRLAAQKRIVLLR